MKTAYVLTDHLCRNCASRILKAVGQPSYRCSQCDWRSEGASPERICICGSQKMNGQPTGLRCARNPNPTPENPGEIVVMFVGEGV